MTSGSDAPRRPLLTNSASHFVVLVNFPRMEDDFPSSEQDFEDNDDPGWYPNATWTIQLWHLVFHCQMLRLLTNLSFSGVRSWNTLENIQ